MHAEVFSKVHILSKKNLAKKQMKFLEKQEKGSMQIGEYPQVPDFRGNSSPKGIYLPEYIRDFFFFFFIRAPGFGFLFWDLDSSSFDLSIPPPPLRAPVPPVEGGKFYATPLHSIAKWMMGIY